MDAVLLARIQFGLTAGFAGIFFLPFFALALYLPAALKRPLAWIFTVLVLTALFFLRTAVQKGIDLLAFTFSSLGFIGLWEISVSVHFPNLVIAGNDPALSITIQNGLPVN